MAMPALKCPYLTQFTLQQIRTSAPQILHRGRESCPIFERMIRTIVTTSSKISSSNIPMTMIHDKLLGEKSLLSTMNKTSSPMSESKMRLFFFVIWRTPFSLKVLFLPNVEIFHVRF